MVLNNSIFSILFRLLRLNFVSSLAYVLATLLLSRNSSPSEIGMFAIWVFAVELVAIVSDVGFGHQVLQRNAKPEEINKVFFANLAVSFLYLCICGFVGLIFFPQNAELFFLLCIFKFISIVFSVHSAQAYLEEKYIIESKINLFLLLTVSILSIFLLHFDVQVLFLLTLLYGIPKLSSMIITLFISYRPKMDVDFSVLKEYVKSGVYLIPNNAMIRLHSQIERALIGFFYNIDVLGFFMRSRTFSDSVSNVVFSSGRQLLTRKLSLIKSKVEKENYFQRYLIVVLLAVSAPLVCISALSKDLILLFLGEAWLESASYIVVLAPFVLVSLKVNLDKIFLFSLYENRSTGKVTFVQIILYVLSFSLIDYFGGSLVEVILLTTLLYLFLSLMLLRKCESVYKAEALLVHVYLFLLYLIGVLYSFGEYSQGSFFIANVLVLVIFSIIAYVRMRKKFESTDTFTKL